MFHPHIDFAHRYWQNLLQPGDIAIDATCGNGHDTLMLAKLCLSSEKGVLFALDIHPRAIALTTQLLKENLSPALFEKIKIVQGCHSRFPSELETGSVKLIVYNLGYLPGGGDKSHTTQVKTTLESISQAMFLLKKGGCISLTLYPGHEAGKEETDQILPFAASLDRKLWNCSHHAWINRSKAPSLLFIQKNDP